ncbi:MAG TPA: hypothetical protein VGJ05_15775, partial [Fimbriiglobus sp.]
MTDDTITDAEFDSLDKHLDTLFAPVRPGASMESRLVYALRNVPARPPLNRARKAFVWATAATVGLGTIGAGVSMIEGMNNLPMPGALNSQSIGMLSPDIFPEREARANSEIRQLTTERPLRDTQPLWSDMPSQSGISKSDSGAGVPPPVSFALDYSGTPKLYDIPQMDGVKLRQNSYGSAGTPDGGPGKDTKPRQSVSEGMDKKQSGQSSSNSETFNELVTKPTISGITSTTGNPAGHAANEFGSYYWNAQTLGIQPPNSASENGNTGKGFTSNSTASLRNIKNTTATGRMYGYYVPNDAGSNKTTVTLDDNQGKGTSGVTGATRFGGGGRGGGGGLGE